MKYSKDSAGIGRFGEPGVLILLSLSSGVKHGYALITDIEQESGIKLGPGTLYGSLAKLLERGLIRKVKSTERRQPYELTVAGKQAITTYIATWEPIIRLGKERLA